MNKEETIKEIVKYYPTYYDVVERLLFIQQENKQLKSRLQEKEKIIEDAFEYIKKLSSKGRDCEIYWDIKKEILSILERK